MLVFVIGLTAVAQLLAVSLTMHADAREATTDTQQAQGKLDELMKLSFTAPSVQISGANSLTSNVADHFDAPAPSLLRRWRVVDGPAAGTRLVTVRVINDRARQYGRQIDLTTVIRQW